MRPFIPFDLERWQSNWEHTVRHNLAESGVAPLSVRELLELTGTDQTELGAVRLGYSQTIGTEALRNAIATLYPAATADNVLVTVGSSEANFLTTWTLAGPGTRVAIQVPVYKQIVGIAANLGAEVTTFGLDQHRGWALDRDGLAAAVSSGPDAVVVTNPNNPTGHILTPEERAAIVEGAERHGSWLVVDEVYRGAEFDGRDTETFWGSTDRTIVTGGLSKAYGLPGLRLGWIVAPPAFIAEAAARHDYAVIGPSGISDFLAIRALGSRDILLARTRRMLRESYSALDAWRRDELPDVLDWTPPEAGAILFARYRLPISSLDLVERLRTAHGVLLVPGAHFDQTDHLRFGFGEPPAVLEPALAAVGAGFRELLVD